MKQSQIIFRFLFPSNQNPSKAVHPTVGAFNNPSPSFESCVAFDGLRFLSTVSNMRCVSKLRNQISNFIRIVSFVQTQTLWFLSRWYGTFNGNTLQRCFRQLNVMAVRRFNHQSHWNSRGFTQHTSFDTAFGSIRRIWSGFFSRPTELWSWLRPLTARTSLTLSTHRTLPTPVSTASETLGLRSTLENGNEPLNCYKSRYHSTHSTGIRFVKQKRFHSLPFDHPLVDDRLQTDACSYVLAAAAQSFSTICLKLNTESPSFVSSLLAMNLLVFAITRLFISYINSGLFG